MGTASCVTGTVAANCSPTGGAAVLSGLLLQTKPNMKSFSIKNYKVFQMLKANNGKSIWSGRNTLDCTAYSTWTNCKSWKLTQGDLHSKASSCNKHNLQTKNALFRQTLTHECIQSWSLASIAVCDAALGL